MPSMSYCMFENTLSDLGQCVSAMEEANTLADLKLNEYEHRAFMSMWNECRSFLAEHERLLITENKGETV